MQPGVHTKFVDDSDDEMIAAAPAAPPLAGPATASHPSPTAQLRCSFTIRTDYDAQAACYVLQVVHSPGAGLVAATLSNTLTKLYAFR